MKEIPWTAWCKAYGIPEPRLEYRFHPTRKWRFDACWPDVKVAVEIQGGVWIGGKHGRGSGIVKDYEKLNHGQIAGWIILQLTPRDISSGAGAPLVLSAIRSRI